jgi:glycosyltransferase involved in cell wall biosynthesis
MTKPQMIVFGEDWGGLPSSTQHIIKQMSGRYSITWVNSLGLRSPKATWHDAKRVFNKAARIAKQLLKPRPASNVPTKVITNDGFKVVEPQYLPFPGNKFARRINRVLLRRLLTRNVKPQVVGERPVIWISLPNAVDALYYIEKTGLVDPVIIYYCCDDFSALHGVDHQAVTALEVELAEQVDLIVATSDKLVEKFPHGKTNMIPHGVDTSLFCQQSVKADDLPTDKPIAGFYGSISSWIDIELLCRLAVLMPQWNIVMIGAIHTDVSRLQAIENVYFLGQKGHSELPAYSQHWQVSLLPFVLNEQIIASNPLKLREYMAAGSPIISVDFPQVRQYQDHIHIADGAEQFAQAMHDSLQDSPSQRAARQLKVADESWQSVASQIDRLIQAV